MQELYVTRSSMPPYEEYCKAIRPLWESHWLTNMGEYHRELEGKLTEYLDVAKVSLTANGHMALELSIQSFDFPANSEVITTPYTFISTTHAIVRNGLQPVFCDVKEVDGTIDESKIEELITPKTVAILPVHVYGHICNIDVIQDIANKYGLKVIYDACHAFGEKYRGIGVASFGDVSVFSFHATKVFNTIEGGAVCSNNHDIYERIYNLKNFGIRGEELVVSVGANAKMNEFQAIMGLCNLKYISKSIESRKRISDIYRGNLCDIKGVSLFGINEDQTYNYSYFPIVINEKCKRTRDDLCEELRKNGIYGRKYFYPITSDQACFKNRYKNCKLDIARKLSDSILLLPIYEEMKESECLDVISCLRMALEEE